MSAPTPPPRRLPDVRTDMDRVRQIIRHQALGHAVRYFGSVWIDTAQFLDDVHEWSGDVLEIAEMFAHWIETGEQP